MALLDTIDLLPSDVSIGDLHHDDMHDQIHVGLKDLKTVFNTLSGESARLVGNQTIAGIKTFSSSPIIPTPTTDMQASTKLYVDTGLSGKASTSHSHTIANITSLQSTLDGKANTSHTHTISDITSLQSSLDAKLSLSGGTLTGDLASSGSARFSGSYVEASTTQGIYAGIGGSSARIMFANGTASQNWQIDNSSGIFRWFLPGVEHMTLSTSSLNIKNKVIDNVNNPTTAQQAATKNYVDTAVAGVLTTGVVSTSGNQTIDGIKTFTSSPRLTTSSTAGYAWVATGSDGTGQWSAIVNAPGGTVPWANITGRPSTFPSEAHVHAISDITNLSSTISGKVDATRTITAGTGLTGGGDLSANRTLAVVYGTAAGTAAQGNDSRLSDQRTPLDGSVTTAKIPDTNITLAKLATTARAYDFSFVQSLDTRAVGYGEMIYGTRISRAIVITSIRYRMGTADASGTTTAQIYTSATAATANTALAGTSGTAAIDPTAVTGSFSIAAGTHFYVYTSAIGTTPGKGLIVEIEAYLA